MPMLSITRRSLLRKAFDALDRLTRAAFEHAGEIGLGPFGARSLGGDGGGAGDRERGAGEDQDSFFSFYLPLARTMPTIW